MDETSRHTTVHLRGADEVERMARRAGVTSVAGPALHRGRYRRAGVA
ncbi:MAG TPA: hypothetical protein VIJ23_09095 [Mycobacterium sp.]